jgi:transketolase
MDRWKKCKLEKLALDVRYDCLNTQKLVESGHLGGSFSIAELLVYLYFEKMNINPDDPKNEERDIFILSKGHASLALYSILARRGFLPVEELKTYRKLGSRLQGHSHIDSVPGVECTTGSLGQGMSFGLGLALGYKKLSKKNKVYVMVGDGELEEGQNWEALMLQEKLKLDNLVIIVDKNRLQLDGFTENITGMNNLKQKFEAFQFNTIEINGHDFSDIESGFNSLKEKEANIIIANTVKGKGVSFMENSIEWHGKKVNQEEYEKALAELRETEAQING